MYVFILFKTLLSLFNVSLYYIKVRTSYLRIYKVWHVAIQINTRQLGALTVKFIILCAVNVHYKKYFQGVVEM